MSATGPSVAGSSFTTTTSERYYEKTEYLHFPKVVKRRAASLPKVLSPIFKWKAEDKPAEKETEDKSTRSAALEEDVEYEEFGEEEYEMSEFEEDYEEKISELIATVSDDVQPLPTEESRPNFGSPLSLATLCLKVFANNFHTMWKYVKFIPTANSTELAHLIDFNSTDVGLAAKTFLDDQLWKLWTIHKWPGYHRPWAHRGSWKHYFLQKHLGETISNQSPSDNALKQLVTLSKRICHWIFKLTITGIRPASWPTVVDIDSSTDSDVELSSNINSQYTLTKYLDRHINYFPPPKSIDRLILRPIFERLKYLTHLNFSFGFENYSRRQDGRFARISTEDASNLGSALKTCTKLYCFKLSQSKLSPELLSIILKGMEKLEFLRELDLSRLFLTNQHMDCISDFLSAKRNIRTLALANNDIGADGFIKLLHVIVLEDCRLTLLDASMNPIGDAGGVAMASLLAKKGKFLKRLFLSGTQMTGLSGYNFGVVLYFNKCLVELDLSLNEFNDFAAEALTKGMEHNYTLKRINLRECGIPFPTVREIESICYENMERAHRRQYKYPEVRPTDYTEGMALLDVTTREDKRQTDDEMEREELQVAMELMQIFSWATYPMRPRNRLVLLRDLHSWMKKTSFVASFDVIADKLVLCKQKELIHKAKIDEIRENEERTVDESGNLVDSSLQEFAKKTNDKFKADFKEVEAIQLLKDINRCGRLDALFKSVKPDKLEGILKKIGKALDGENDFLLSSGVELPFALKFYRGFPNPQSASEDGEVDGEGDGEERFVPFPDLLRQFEDRSVRSNSVQTAEKPSIMTSTSIWADSHTKLPKEPPISMPIFRDERSFIAARNKAIGIRSRYNKWPKDGPPKFPKVIPFEIVDECYSNLPDTESEKEEDFPYWTAEWVQKM